MPLPLSQVVGEDTDDGVPQTTVAAKIGNAPQLFAVEDEYVREYNKISGAHEAKHGNMITNAYEKAIDGLESRKQKQVNGLKKMDKLNGEKEKDSVLRKNEAMVIQLEKSLKAIKLRNDGALKDSLKALQAELIVLDQKLDNTFSGLSAAERNVFAAKREKLKNKPCLP